METCEVIASWLLSLQTRCKLALANDPVRSLRDLDMLQRLESRGVRLGEDQAGLTEEDVEKLHALIAGSGATGRLAFEKLAEVGADGPTALATWASLIEKRTAESVTALRSMKERGALGLFLTTAGEGLPAYVLERSGMAAFDASGDAAPPQTASAGAFLEALTQLSAERRLDEVFDLANGHRICYSQEGESLVLGRLFSNKPNGFFVDVGAHHPRRFSNTYSLYKAGWRGLNIDPSPEAKSLFAADRPEDIFLDIAISAEAGEMNMYMFEEPALNTFAPELAREYEQAGYKVKQVTAVKTLPLSQVIDEFAPGRQIDLMSVDVEDHELMVLQSNDWSRCRPSVLVVEILGFDMKHLEQSPVHNYIVRQGYTVFAKTFNSVFYRENGSSDK